ncbi:MAG: HAMP domain-containing sensor histidine kinase [Anaerovoracaceae bacterium]
MKNIRLKMQITIISIMIIVFVIVMLTFNLLMNSYVEKQGLDALQREIGGGSKIEQEGDSPILTKRIYLNKNYEREKSDYMAMPFTDKEQKIIDYYKNNENIKEGIIGSFETKNEDMLTVKLISSDKFITLIYVDLSPLKDFGKTVNMALSIIMLICSVIAIFVGIIIGGKIESSQGKMKKFFANASHELKTPLMSIQGYAEGIKLDILKDNKQGAQIILNESEKMADLIEELLFLSKIDSGEMVLHKEKFDIKELIYEIMESQGIVAKQKGVVINDLMASDQVEILVDADEKQIRKALNNIVSNGIKYANSTIDIKCQRENDTIFIEIKDDGKGILSEDMPHIFERFYKGKEGNTGIGLSLAKEIVELHKGEITAESDEDGALFKINLPI